MLAFARLFPFLWFPLKFFVVSDGHLLTSIQFDFCVVVRSFTRAWNHFLGPVESMFSRINARVFSDFPSFMAEWQRFGLICRQRKKQFWCAVSFHRLHPMKITLPNTLSPHSTHSNINICCDEMSAIDRLSRTCTNTARILIMNGAKSDLDLNCVYCWEKGVAV